jgi:hypothetical protein
MTRIKNIKNEETMIFTKSLRDPLLGIVGLMILGSIVIKYKNEIKTFLKNKNLLSKKSPKKMVFGKSLKKLKKLKKPKSYKKKKIQKVTKLKTKIRTI